MKSMDILKVGKRAMEGLAEGVSKPVDMPELRRAISKAARPKLSRLFLAWIKKKLGIRSLSYGGYEYDYLIMLRKQCKKD